MFWDKSIWEFCKDWSEGLSEEEHALVLEIGWEDLPFWKDFCLIICKVRSSSREFEWESTQVCT